jgi:hypothetical protein
LFFFFFSRGALKENGTPEEKNHINTQSLVTLRNGREDEKRTGGDVVRSLVVWSLGALGDLTGGVPFVRDSLATTNECTKH